jgi:hypothetical protein
MVIRHTVGSSGRRVAFIGVIIAGGALGLAGPAAADPEVPLPPPADPAATTPAPGQPVMESTDEPAGPQPPPPVGAPPVPEIPNAVYGQGQTPGQFGYLRDLWHAFHSANPIEALTVPPGQAPGPPPGAGPPPPLPPGHVSLTAPQPPTQLPPGLPAEAPPAPGPPPGPPVPLPPTR